MEPPAIPTHLIFLLYVVIAFFTLTLVASAHTFQCVA